MGNEFKFPNEKSVIYWPVGTGDSTTLILKPGEIVVQIDLHHLEKSDDPDEPEWQVIDHLIKILPQKNGKPYLSLFILTHPDKDHVLGFAELLRRVTIGEIWHTPKIFRDQSDQESMCDDAKAFRKEAHRRRKIISNDPSNIKSGDKLRVIGYDEILAEDEYKKIPADCKSRPGEIVSTVDGISLASEFHAFIHAPFKDDQAKDKNNTSLSLNIVIYEGQQYAQFFFFGDREYLTIKRIFEATEQSKAKKDNTGYLGWHVMLCPHHCSKGAMYWQDENDIEEVFKKDIMDYFINNKRTSAGYIVSSSHSNFTDGDGHLPPHKKARNQYEKIVSNGRFICTHEYPDKKNPEPIIFTIDSKGLNFDDKRQKKQGPAGLAAAVLTARGNSQPSGVQIGQG